MLAAGGVAVGFVRVVARSPITIPKGSWREGKTCFICADEFTVQ